MTTKTQIKINIHKKEIEDLETKSSIKISDHKKEIKRLEMTETKDERYTVGFNPSRRLNIMLENAKLKNEKIGEHVLNGYFRNIKDPLTVINESFESFKNKCNPVINKINKPTSNEFFECTRVISLKVIQGEYLSSELIEIYKTITANPHNMHKIYKINEEQTAEIKTLTAENEKLTAIVESLMKMSNPPQSRDSE